MANLGSDQLRLEKSIVIDARTAKELEARGEILQSDAYVDRDKGEVLAPALVQLQEVVDANTAARLAAARGINLSQSVDAAANVHFGGNPILHPEGNIPSTSKLPTAILESFKKQPPLIPTIEQTTPEFNPEFLAQVQEMNKRLNKAGGDPASRIPKTAQQQPLNETRAPATNIYAEMNAGGYAQPRYANPSPVAPASNIDYSLISAIIKEAVREVMKDINIKEVVKEVLKEERENVVKKPVNENIQLIIGGSTFSGKISAVQTPVKK